MNLNQLTYFVTLAQIENYTRAAKRLDITQPSLSHADEANRPEEAVKEK